MNQQNINICPVCGETLNNGLCPKCGYLRLIFPSVVPEALKYQESVRIKKAQNVLDEFYKLKKQDQDSEKMIDKLKSTIIANKEASQESETKILGLESKINELEFNNKSLKSQLKESKSKLNEYVSQIKELTKILSSNNLEMDRLKRDLEDFAKRPTKTNAFLILLYDGEYSVMPVENERRYYATGPGMDLCPVHNESQIIMLPIMTSIKTAFSIEKSDTAFRLTDFSGNLRSTGLVRGNKLRLTQGVTIQVEESNMRLYFCIN